MAAVPTGRCFSPWAEIWSQGFHSGCWFFSWGSYKTIWYFICKTSLECFKALLLSASGVCLYRWHIPNPHPFWYLPSFQPPQPPGDSPLQVLWFTPGPPRMWDLKLTPDSMCSQGNTSEGGSLPLDWSSIWTNYTDSNNAALAIFGSRFLLPTHIKSTKSHKPYLQAFITGLCLNLRNRFGEPKCRC